MTYVPVPPDAHKGPGGRTPLEIPEALVRQLQHSASTGARCVIDLTEDDPASAEDIAELKRAIVRARYRLFSDKTIHLSIRDDRIEYWVAPKQPRKRKESGKP